MAGNCGQAPMMDEVQLFISPYRSRSRSHGPWVPETVPCFVTFGSQPEGEGAESKRHPARYLTLIDFVSRAKFPRSQYQDEKQCDDRVCARIDPLGVTSI